MATDLSVVVRTRLQLSIPIGPGRLLTKAYENSGRFVGQKIGRLAHQRGLGPDATASRLLKELESREERLVRPAHLRSEVSGELKKDCQKLLKYASPIETSATQLKTFKNIIYLTTRFPGLRHVFGRCKALRAAGATRACTIIMWTGRDPPPDVSERWTFFLRFAASCIFEDDAGVASILENANSKIDDLGYIPVDSGEFSVIERLLVASESSDNFEPWIAIRYLGRILASRSFWDQPPHSNHQTVTKKLFQRVMELVEDMDMEGWATTDIFLRKIRGDIEGIDVLTCALLNGVEIWCRQNESRPSGPSLTSFQRLMRLIRHVVAEDLLPRSFATASFEYADLVGMPLRCELVEVLTLSSTPSSNNSVYLERTSIPGEHPALLSSPPPSPDPSTHSEHPPIQPRPPSPLSAVSSVHNPETTTNGDENTVADIAENLSEPSTRGVVQRLITSLFPERAPSEPQPSLPPPATSPTPAPPTPFNPERTFNEPQPPLAMSAPPLPRDPSTYLEHVPIQELLASPSSTTSHTLEPSTSLVDPERAPQTQPPSPLSTTSLTLDPSTPFGDPERAPIQPQPLLASSALSLPLDPPTYPEHTSIRRQPPSPSPTTSLTLDHSTSFADPEHVSPDSSQPPSPLSTTSLTLDPSTSFVDAERPSIQPQPPLASSATSLPLDPSTSMVADPEHVSSEPQPPSPSSTMSLTLDRSTSSVDPERASVQLQPPLVSPSTLLPKDQILILIMGSTGVGKSTFINAAVGKDVVTVGHGLYAYTKRLTHVSCSHPFKYSKSRIVLVDTPGFDDTYIEDSQVLALIIDWMRGRGNDGTKFGGILYLSEGHQRYLPLFKELCSNATIRDAILHVETKSPQSNGIYFANTRESAWSIIDKVVEQPCSNDINRISMQLADIRKRLPKPKASIPGIWSQFESLFS